MIIEAFLEVIFRENIVPMMIFEFSGMTILDANNAFQKTLALSRREIKSMKIDEFIIRPDFKNIKKIMEELPVIEKRILNLKIKAFLSEPFYAKCCLQKIEINNKILCLFQLLSDDLLGISDQSINEDKCYKKIMSEFPEPLCLVDFSELLDLMTQKGLSNNSEILSFLKSNKMNVLTLIKKTKILYLNPATIALYKADSALQLISRITMFFRGLNLKDTANFIEAIFHKNLSFSIDAINKTMKGNTIFVNIKWSVVKGHENNLNRVLLSISDLTNMKRVEKSVKRLDSRFRAIFDSSAIGISILNKELRIIEVNQALLKMSGYEAETLKEMNIYDIIYPENINSFKSVVKELFIHYEKAYQTEERIINENKNIFWWRFTISPIISDPDEPRYLIAIIEDITEKRKAEDEREKLFREINTAQKRLKMLSKNLLQVQEAERSSISRELHDEIGQVLTAIKIEMQSTLKLSDDKKVRNHMKEGIQLVEYALNKARDLSINLRPSILDDLGLIPAVRWFLDRQVQRTKLKVKFNSNLEAHRFSPEMEITCYRVIQEAVTNILRHASAKNIWIEIKEIDNKIKLQISDDGKGFDIDSVIKRSQEGKSMGVINMMERVELVGGKLKLDYYYDKKGTNITAEFPL